MENNKTYRIRTEVGKDKFLHVKLDQDYDTFEILSLRVSQTNDYLTHTSDYGVVVGRVLANYGMGIPNAKLSIFIAKSDNESTINSYLYPFSSTSSKGKDDKRYNLLPDYAETECYQAVGSFPSKRYVLDNDNVVEIFDSYYKFTTKTNNSGDYMFFGVPTGNQTIHMDLDLSDCGILSQKPRDFVYKGYSIDQFENAAQFKVKQDIDSLPQIFSQDKSVDVMPYWGDEASSEEIGITRCDINVDYEFQPTCVFLGSIFTDSSSNGISKKCKPSKRMGLMNQLVAGSGTIEMIRHTISGTIEEHQVQGTQLIDADGTWCYQIPMNLDYMMTDEYGNLVASNNPKKGVPTRARVRFRISSNDEQASQKFFQAKVLVPNNPGSDSATENAYIFGTSTPDDEYRDLFWNCVYSVKSYIPRLQRVHSNYSTRRTKRFIGIKGVTRNEDNSSIPYNHLRVKLPMMYKLICAYLNFLIGAVGSINQLFQSVEHIVAWWNSICRAGSTDNIIDKVVSVFQVKHSLLNTYYTIHTQYCDSLEGAFLAPGVPYREDDDHYPGADDHSTTRKRRGDDNDTQYYDETTPLVMGTYMRLAGKQIGETLKDSDDIDSDEEICLMGDEQYVMECVEMGLAEEYEVLNFDFYNDWLNGTIYMPRWERQVKKRRTNGSIRKIKSCADTNGSKSKRIYIGGVGDIYYGNDGTVGGGELLKNFTRHMWKRGESYKLLGKTSLIHGYKTMLGDTVYYYKPYYSDTNLFATDIILLGSLEDCNIFGVPFVSGTIPASTYQLPEDLAVTNYMDNDEGDEFPTLGCFPIAKITALFGDTKSKLKETRKNIVYHYNETWEDDAPKKLALAKEVFQAFASGSGGGDMSNSTDDEIPMTEASGINWGYEGPNQRVIGTSPDDYMFYSPGGMFIGLACDTDDTITNIKSTINLIRACEYGVSLSEMNEETSNGSSYESIQVPNGFIAQDDIEDNDFRSQFATMNSNKLIGTMDSNGFYKYNFSSMNPTNFDGTFEEFVELSQSEIQTIAITLKITNILLTSIQAFSALLGCGLLTIPMSIVLSRLIGDKKRKLFPYNYNGEVDVDTTSSTSGSLDDEDSYAASNMYSRCIESESNDYVKFRFGGSRNITKNYFPQYQNSYYFYFGLKYGKTSMDRFITDFFAVCNKQDTDLTSSDAVAKQTANYVKNNIDVDTTDFTSAPFVNGNTGASITDKRYEYVNNTQDYFIGGCIQTDLDLPSMIAADTNPYTYYYKIVLTDGETTLSYGYGGSNNDAIIKWATGIYRLPVTNVGKWNVIVYKGDESVCNINVPVESQNGYSGSITIGGNSANTYNWYENYQDYYVKNLSQYDGLFQTAIDLDIDCDDDEAQLVFLGQGEIANPDLASNLDTSHPLSLGGVDYENTTKEETDSSYSLSETAYIPTEGYTNGNGVSRNKFEVTYYHNAKVYTKLITAATKNDCSISLNDGVLSISISDISLEKYGIGMHCMAIIGLTESSSYVVNTALITSETSVEVSGNMSTDIIEYVNLYEMIQIPIKYQPQGGNLFVVVNNSLSGEGIVKGYVTNSVANGLNTNNIEISVDGTVYDKTDKETFFNKIAGGELCGLTVTLGEIYNGEALPSVSAILGAEEDYYTGDAWETISGYDSEDQIVHDENGQYLIRKFGYKNITGDANTSTEISILIYSAI